MGCASSNPLAAGKQLMENAKESATELANKGEHVIQDVGETAKDGAGHVKEAVLSAVETAENSLGSVMGKIGDTFSGAKAEAAETAEGLEKSAEHAAGKLDEVVSEAETVLASEAEDAEKAAAHLAETEVTFEESAEMAFDKVKEGAGRKALQLQQAVSDSLELEDLDKALDMVDGDVERRAEEIAQRLPTPAPLPPFEVEVKKEDPPTFWEARADAILERRLKSIDHNGSGLDPEPDADADRHLEEDTEHPHDGMGAACKKPDKNSLESFVLNEN